MRGLRPPTGRGRDVRVLHPSDAATSRSPSCRVIPARDAANPVIARRAADGGALEPDECGQPDVPYLVVGAGLWWARPFSSPLLKRVEQALTSMLDQHEPFPAVVLDRGWQVQRANNGAQRLFGRLFAPHPVPAQANVLRLVIEPGPMRDQLRNWAAVVPALLDRAHREAIGGVLDRETAELVRNASIMLS